MKKFFNGIKFFSDDAAPIRLGGTATASSAQEDAAEAFNTSRAFGWISDGQASDASAAYLERDFGAPLAGDTLVLANHNLAAFNLEINGEPFICYQLQTARGFSLLRFPLRDDIRSIRITAQKTFPANEEKRVGEVMLLSYLGQFEQPQELKNTLTREQGDLKLQNGKHFIFNCGESWTFSVDMFSLSQADMDLWDRLQNLGTPFYIWPCGGDESQFEYHFRPFLFDDFFKVAFSGNGKPNLKDNMYWTGLRDSVKLVEVE